ncbi:head-tail connector protein [Roseivivax isoporae]|uniref:Gene transfer agent protein n=1 Tax=Roseivivax isoporae LMG 25204 TaxID=1449351 RepID=X7F663_9RHOB|nr:head-tail connector protein [Roseivivax isoporae]ETX28243.1 gene transfer agent protein [Roseivivax isoporae LMG 25204]
MMLIEETAIAEDSLPLEALKRHLRLGTGFAVDGIEDPVLASFLRAALAAAEARTGKTILSRGFVLTLGDWTDPEGQPLGTAPVRAITQVTLIDRFGTADLVAAERYRLERDSQLPRLRPTASLLPSVPTGGAVEIRFVAGYADHFEDVPADLAQAVLLLAAHYYEYRDETALGQGCMPFGVTSLLARYRVARIGFAS